MSYKGQNEKDDKLVMLLCTDASMGGVPLRRNILYVYDLVLAAIGDAQTCRRIRSTRNSAYRTAFGGQYAGVRAVREGEPPLERILTRASRNEIAQILGTDKLGKHNKGAIEKLKEAGILPLPRPDFNTQTEPTFDDAPVADEFFESQVLDCVTPTSRNL